MIPLYSWLTIGNPFQLPYSFQASFPEMQKGLYAIQWPDPETAWHLLASPQRGLIFWTPFLLVSIFGYAALAHRSQSLFWLTYGIPLAQVIVISGRIWDWPAGPAFGARYLTPILPLLALPCALGLEHWPKTGRTLALYSIIITALATLTNACPGFDPHPNPLIDLNIPLFLRGELSPNLGRALGLPPYISIALFLSALMGGAWRISRQLTKARMRMIDSAAAAKTAVYGPA